MKKFNDQVVYQIYPKSFYDSNGDGYGDINGIIQKLDYIKDLGVDYIWLSPVNKSPQYDNGYDISDYLDIDPIFGTLADYKNLISCAKERNLKVMLDLVLNHTSDQHEWFLKALLKDEDYYDFYIWRDKPNDMIGYFSKSTWTYVKSLDKYYFHLFDTHQPDLNWENPKLRKLIFDQVNFWIKLGVEGFRLDVIDLIGKDPDNYITAKGPNFLKFLEELHSNTFGSDILTVGECWNATLKESISMCGKKGLSQVFHFNHLTTTNIDGNKWEQSKLDFNEIVKILTYWHNNYLDSQSIVMNNHDMPRLTSLWLDDSSFRYQSATNLALLFTFLRGTQYIYQGEEIAMSNLNLSEINLYNDVETLNIYQELIKKYPHDIAMQKIKLISRDNARSTMQWDDSVYGGFSTATPWTNTNTNYIHVNVKNDLASLQSVYKFYQAILKFKKANYQLVDEDILDSYFSDEILVIKKKSTTLICNMTNQSCAYDIKGEVLFNNYDQATCLEPYQALLVLN